MTSTLNDLKDQAAAQAVAQEAQAAYHKAQQQSLYKESQVEAYTAKIKEAKDTLNQDNGYMAYAIASGHPEMGVVWWQKAQEAQQQVNELQAQLDYWTNVDPTSIKLAEGGVVSSKTLAWVGEGRETEVVQPLSHLKSLLFDANTNQNAELVAAIRQLDARMEQVEINTRKTAANTNNRDAYKDYATGAQI